MAGAGEGARHQAAQILEDLEGDPGVEIVPQTGSLFVTAAARHTARADQSWRITDCASFPVVEERGLSGALAYDRDFKQASLSALLREGPT